MVDLVIFDMDGVLTDSEGLINEAAVRFYKELGYDILPEDFYPFVGTGEDRYIGGVAEKYGIALNLSEAKKRTYEIYLDLVPSRLKAFPGAVRLTREIRSKGIKTAVASSADKVKVNANLNAIGLIPAKDWDLVVSGEMVKRKKPAPDIFLHAAESLKVSPSRCVVIEDAVHGIEAAIAAGMWCVGVAQTFAKDKLHMASVVYQDLDGLIFEDLVPK